MAVERSDALPGQEANGAIRTSSRGEAAPAVGSRMLVPLLAALMASALAIRLNLTINNDVAWYIYSANAFLDGGRLYDDIFFEVNPPLMLYLTLPGAVLARLSGMGPVSGYVLSVFALVGLTLALGRAALPAAHRAPCTILVCLVLVVLPAGDFGQRSHAMVALALPYLLLIGGRLSGGAPGGRALAAVVGVTAGLGFAIKPHYLLVPAVLEGMLWWRTRGAILRAETAALGAVLAAYACSIVLLTPEYVTRVVPYAIEIYNSAYRNDWSFVLARSEMLLVPGAALAHWRVRRRLAGPERALGDVFAAAALALLAIYLIQMKGWNYHIYPATAMLVLLAGNLALSSRLGPPLRLAGAALVGLLVAKAALVAENRYPLMDRLMPVIETRNAGAIYFFSSNTWTGFPMTVYADVEWTSRFPALWPLPGIVNARSGGVPTGDAEALAEIEDFVRRAVIADLEARLPDIVLVDARPEKPWYRAPGFDFIAHFSIDPRFAALWERYQRIGEVEGFVIYQREAAPDASSSIN